MSEPDALVASLASAVCQRRLELGLGVEGLDGVSRQKLWRVERAEANPSLSALEAIATALRWTTSELLAAAESHVSARDRAAAGLSRSAGSTLGRREVGREPRSSGTRY